MGDQALSERLKGEAERLRKAFDEKFWLPEIGTYASAPRRRSRPAPDRRCR
jgi:glycogen debranching enzyme